MKSLIAARTLALIAAAFAAPLAGAHPGHDIADLSWGLAHLFTSLEHVLTLVAIGAGLATALAVQARAIRWAGAALAAGGLGLLLAIA
jgi:hydrogenase/urease accessory protein HupE